MSPMLKTLGSLAAAAAMVGAAVVGRNALDTKSERDGLRLTVACDPVAEAFCRAAAAADPRITLQIESPEKTTKALGAVEAGERPTIQAWVSVGPWLQMADGRRPGQAPLQKGPPIVVAETPLVLATRRGQTLGPCPGKPPAGCLPLPRSRLGLASPRSSGVGLAGLAQIVLAQSGIPVADLDRSAIESGPAATAIDAVARAVDPDDGLGRQLAASFSLANPVVTTQAAAAPVADRVAVVTSDPPVRAVLQVGFLDEAARLPLSSGDPAGRALAKAATDAGWGPPGQPSGGLPDPGVLAALQDAWTGP